MEETKGIRIADARMAEAASTGAGIVATACPFCSQMLGSATGSSLPGPGFPGATSSSPEPGDPTASGTTGSQQPLPLPEVRDVAVLLLDGVRRGQARGDHDETNH